MKMNEVLSFLELSEAEEKELAQFKIDIENSYEAIKANIDSIDKELQFLFEE